MVLQPKHTKSRAQYKKKHSTHGRVSLVARRRTNCRRLHNTHPADGFRCAVLLMMVLSLVVVVCCFIPNRFTRYVANARFIDRPRMCALACCMSTNVYVCATITGFDVQLIETRARARRGTDTHGDTHTPYAKWARVHKTRSASCTRSI